MREIHSPPPNRSWSVSHAFPHFRWSFGLEGSVLHRHTSWLLTPPPSTSTYELWTSGHCVQLCVVVAAAAADTCDQSPKGRYCHTHSHATLIAACWVNDTARMKSAGEGGVDHQRARHYFIQTCYYLFIDSALEFSLGIAAFSPKSSAYDSSGSLARGVLC